MASVLGRRVVVVPWPVWAQYALAQVTVWTMKVPLVAKAQVRMLAEGVTVAAPPAASVPDDLRPRRKFTAEHPQRAARARWVRMARPADQRLTGSPGQEVGTGGIGLRRSRVARATRNRCSRSFVVSRTRSGAEGHGRVVR